MIANKTKTGTKIHTYKFRNVLWTCHHFFISQSPIGTDSKRVCGTQFI